MPYFKSTFYKSNFDFHEEIKQSFDVVFEINESEVTEENYKKFRNACWKAAAEQIPKSDPKMSGLPLGGGWSSMLGGHEFVKLTRPWDKWKIQIPKPGKPTIACSFTKTYIYSAGLAGQERHFRATGFYKLISYTPKPEPIMDDVFPERSKPRWLMVNCIPQEAHIISGCGIAGCVELIQDVEIGPLVKWAKNVIQREQWQYVETLAIRNSDPNRVCNDLFRTSDFKRDIPGWVEKLGLKLQP